MSAHACRSCNPDDWKWLKSKRHEIAGVVEDVEKQKLLCAVGGNVNWCSHCGKWYGSSS